MLEQTDAYVCILKQGLGPEGLGPSGLGPKPSPEALEFHWITAPLKTYLLYYLLLL